MKKYFKHKDQNTFYFIFLKYVRGAATISHLTQTFTRHIYMQKYILFTLHAGLNNVLSVKVLDTKYVHCCNEVTCLEIYTNT